MPDSDSSHKRKKDKSNKKKRRRSDESSSKERKSSKSKRHEELPEEKRMSSSAIPDESITPSCSGEMAKASNPERSESSEIYGPSLPPKLTETKTELRERIVGPILPPGFQPPEPTVQSTDSSDDSDFVGPLPPRGSNVLTETELQLEERALQIKLGKLDPNAGSHGEAKVREEWMLELPEVNSLKNLGPTNRKFRAKEGPDFSDRSSWTETPQNKGKKPKSSKDKAEEKYIKERDKEQERMARKHSKKHKRDKSLLELHQKSLEKEKDKSKNDKAERRPFSRDMDLQPNRFDASRTASAINKAQFLNDRFSTGKAKYL